MDEDTALEMMLNWHSEPKPDNVVHKPDKLFRYHGGYKMFRGQKPRRVNPPSIRAASKFRSAHP